MKVERVDLDFFSGFNFQVENSCVFLDLKEEGNTVSHNFCFKLTKIETKTEVSVVINNAGKSKFAMGWKGYLPFISEDGSSYVRVSESYYNDGVFSFKFTPNTEECIVAYYPPYSLKDLDVFLEKHKIVLNYLEDGITPFVLLGSNTNIPTTIIINRQHPGEFQGSYFLEGIVDSYYMNSNKCNLLIFPLLNITGNKISNHRYTADGIDLNRVWGTNSLLEIVCKKISDTKLVNFIFDVHGDEVSKIDYIYSKTNIKLNLQNSYFSQIIMPSKIRRFFRALLKQRILLFNFGTLAFQFLEKKFTVPCFTIELNAHTNNPIDCYQKGYIFYNETI